jgi:DeoR family glycerol-3-phosphate regulon repressor
VTTTAGRRDEILQLARREGFVSVEALADRFHVTPQTIRRDINVLCGVGELRRHHGGAAPPSSTRNLDYTARQVLNREAKQRIARAVAAFVPDGSSLFVNIGTTNEAVAEALRDHQGLQIITNNLNVAATLASAVGIEVIVTGGLVRARDLGIVGEATLDVIRQFRVDTAIIGASGLDLDGALLEFDYREVRVARELMANARETVLAIDRSKIGRRAMAKICHLADLDHVFCDAPPPAELQPTVTTSKVAWHVAGPHADVRSCTK